MSDSYTAAAAASQLDIAIHGHLRRQQRKCMENFTAMVMKFATSCSTRPLTDARKALIEKRLREEFPHFQTPNHPPYAAMIERAIRELKEPEGCTEESISKFIRKQYDDLPWGHSTLLNHHLLKLCECGEISVTSENCYLLAHGITNLNSAPCSTSERQMIQRKQKQRDKKLSGRARCNRKGQTEGKTQQEQTEVIHGEDLGHEFHNLVVEYQNLAEEQHQEINADLYALQAREQEQQIVLIGDQNHVEGKVVDLEHLELNQPEVLTLERPPGFNVELQRQHLSGESLLACCQQKNLKYRLKTLATSISLHNSKQTQMEQQHVHSFPGEEQQPDFFSPERPLEPYTQQKVCKSLPMTSTALSISMHSEQLSQCKLVLANSGVSEAKKSVTGEVDELSRTLQQVLEEQKQQRCQSHRQYDYVQQKAHTTMQLADRLEVLKSLEKLPETQQQQQGKQCVRKRHAKFKPEVVISKDVPTKSNQQFEFPKAEKYLRSELATAIPSPEEQLQQGKLCVGNKTSKSQLPKMTVSLHLPEEPDFISRGQMSQTECLQQRLKQDGGRKRTRSKSKTMGTEQLAEFPNPEHHHGHEPRPVEEPCSKEEVQCGKSWERHKAPQHLIALEAVIADHGLQKDPKKQPNVSASKQSSQTKSGRQHQDWGRKTSTCTPPMTSKAKFSSSEVQYQERQLPNQESPSEPKQKPMEESTQTTEQQPNSSMLIAPQLSNLPNPEREPQLRHFDTGEVTAETTTASASNV